VTFDATVDSVPAISPDLKWIVFVRFASEDSKRGYLYLIKLEVNDNGEYQTVNPERMQASVAKVEDAPTWSPNGSTIVYSDGGVLMKIVPDVTARPEPLFRDSRTDMQMVAWARR
jgi:Tol biopolymer transport system component